MAVRLPTEPFRSVRRCQPFSGAFLRQCEAKEDIRSGARRGKLLMEETMGPDGQRRGFVRGDAAAASRGLQEWLQHERRQGAVDMDHVMAQNIARRGSRLIPVRNQLLSPHWLL